MSTSGSSHLAAGKYFYDDLRVGDSFATSRITVTEAHIVAFAGMSGDFFDVHMDDEFARAQGFPGRIAHGLLGLCLVDGLKNRAEAQLQAVASLGWSDWSFKAPIVAGDSIGATITVDQMRLTSAGDRGIVQLAFDVYNQSGVTVQCGRNALLMRRARG
ncbi:MaoC family dehydratase [Roseibaca sp. Y0-43]|uniref:MaoC family dehydratase n=1 Tax=Roseibaca sp. Y0-43 TaxID=2816854 RepID=UPI001D0C8A86|nr:MaoC/PaaZ C-terminal domain-containing protein [Roseibaca sp. Y0-43]MCC1482283.1 MaoC family dehydratase N-terminal domain-containing protein [Roseibaca sp. Y0-43]